MNASEINKDIREQIEESGFRFWQIADELGITYTAFADKLLRREMTDEEKKVFSDAIDTLAKKRDRKRRKQNDV